MIKGLWTKLLIVCFVYCLANNDVHAAPIDLPSAITVKDVVSVEGVFLYERELEEKEELKANFFVAKFKNSIENKNDVYFWLGQANDFELSWAENGNSYIIAFDEAFVCGLGINTIFYQGQESGLSLFGDIKLASIYRIDAESITIGGVKSSYNSLGSELSVRYTEGQIALGVSKKIDKLIPYGGVAYSYLDLYRKTTNSVDTTTNHVNGENNFGFFVGCAWKAADGIVLTIEGRLTGEEASAVKLALKF